MAALHTSPTAPELIHASAASEQGRGTGQCGAVGIGPSVSKTEREKDRARQRNAAVRKSRGPLKAGKGLELKQSGARLALHFVSKKETENHTRV